MRLFELLVESEGEVPVARELSLEPDGGVASVPDGDVAPGFAFVLGVFELGMPVPLSLGLLVVLGDVVVEPGGVSELLPVLGRLVSLGLVVDGPPGVAPSVPPVPDVCA